MPTLRWPNLWPAGAALGCAFLTSCNLFETPAPTPLNIEICGSSTLGARLMPRLATRWLGKSYAFADATALDKGVRWCVEGTPEGGVLTEICVTYESSGSGLEGVKNGTCDIGMYSGPWETIRDANPGVEGHNVGSDAIMIVTGSSGSELEDAIALPTLTQWYAGEALPEGLRVLQRAESGSGTSAAFRDLLGLDELKGGATVSADDFTEVGKQGGFFVYYVSAQEQLEQGGFRFLEVKANDEGEALEPSVYNIDHGYPLARPLRLLTKGVTGPAADFVAWTKSADARAVFEPLFMAHVTSQDVQAAPITEACPESPVTTDVAGSRLGTVYFGPGDGAEPRDDWQMGPILRASIAAAQRMGKDLAVVGYTNDSEAILEAECREARQRAELVHLVLEGELKYMPPETNPPGLRPLIIGGPTKAWGPDSADNHATIIMAVDRLEEPLEAPEGEPTAN
ncbi:MAG: substrate-binding domain-containing protein [Myxococcota bacterium]